MAGATFGFSGGSPTVVVVGRTVVEGSLTVVEEVGGRVITVVGLGIEAIDVDVVGTSAAAEIRAEIAVVVRPDSLGAGVSAENPATTPATRSVTVRITNAVPGR